MNVSPINSNSGLLGFGANIKFTNPHHCVTMPKINDYTYAKQVLDRFEKKCPGTDVNITYRKAYNCEGSYLEAKNEKTGFKIREFMTKEDFAKDFNNPYKSFGGSKTFYRLLETLLNPTLMLHSDFWGKENSFKKDISPENHSVII